MQEYHDIKFGVIEENNIPYIQLRDNRFLTLYRSRSFQVSGDLEGDGDFGSSSNDLTSTLNLVRSYDKQLRDFIGTHFLLKYLYEATQNYEEMKFIIKEMKIELNTFVNKTLEYLNFSHVFRFNINLIETPVEFPIGNKVIELYKFIWNDYSITFGDKTLPIITGNKASIEQVMLTLKSIESYNSNLSWLELRNIYKEVDAIRDEYLYKKSFNIGGNIYSNTAKDLKDITSEETEGIDLAQSVVKYRDVNSKNLRYEKELIINIRLCKSIIIIETEKNMLLYFMGIDELEPFEEIVRLITKIEFQKDLNKYELILLINNISSVLNDIDLSKETATYKIIQECEKFNRSELENKLWNLLYIEQNEEDEIGSGRTEVFKK